jgi:YD repeat-containing protein
VDYTYDPDFGRLDSAANGSDTLGWIYDLDGHLLSETSAANASLVEYEYDNSGNRIALTVDSTPFVTYEYDVASRLTAIKRGSDVFGLEYDAASHRETMTYANGVVTSCAYDDESSPESIGAAIGATSVRQEDVGLRLPATP